MPNRTLLRFVTLVLIAAVAALTGCSEDPASVPTVPEVAVTQATCEGCHTSEAMLRATVLRDPEVESEGEG